MTSPRLTHRAPAANVSVMGEDKSVRRRCLRALPVLGGLIGLAALPGCVSVKAPDKPIVIELNINIKQEVIYRLAEDVRQNIDENPEIF